ncbi:DUF2304 domain-containing protein [Cellulomonas taurus]|uniref:DUF2304 domain-containing protein n=1 Tax=Cellulomonas taurus TaxID=2729175 RepID=UPI00145C9E99|nr:DUF2304 domain-containing protein [Cellulomonas taurus]
MSGYIFALAACLLLVVFLVWLLRTRRLREKYAITWLVVGLGVCVFGAFPTAVEWMADLVGVETPSNLLFALALIVLLIVCIQLSTEITTLEEETRTLAEEVALLRYDVEQLAARVGAVDQVVHTTDPEDAGPA